MRSFEEVKREIDPKDPKVRTAADEIWERAALNNLAILDAEKRVLADRSVQYRVAGSQRWVTVERV
jgi:hypothetical protein